jgi:predicted histidine transporter YuiF (NhaC family)
MKKSTISLITSALFLSIGVHAAPVAHNDNVITPQVERDEGRPVKTAFLAPIAAVIIGGMVVAGVAVVIGETTAIIIVTKEKKRKQAARKKQKKIKKAAKKALRKRAEAEYAHRHMPHKWRMLQP